MAGNAPRRAGLHGVGSVPRRGRHVAEKKLAGTQRGPYLPGCRFESVAVSVILDTRTYKFAKFRRE